MSESIGKPSQRAIVPTTLDGVRLDVALTRLFPSLSRRQAQLLCESGQVEVGSRRSKKSDLARAGELVILTPSTPKIAAPIPGPLDLRLVTDHWVVVAKPAAVHTAPRDGIEGGTIANALAAAFPEMRSIGHHPLEPGLLHRLDTGTSGLLVAARSQQAFELGTRALKQSLWTKTYFAVVARGRLPSSGELTGALVSDPKHPKRVRLDGDFQLTELPSESERQFPLGPFVTRFTTVRESEDTSLLEVTVGPAFRHQIRAHCAAAGAPLLNDVVYGAPADARLSSSRHALHAARVAWVGESFLTGFDVIEPLPLDLSGLFERGDDGSRSSG
ncbi:MAG: RluA family pseudouridine synthase [Polyangiaceae bacterium]